MLKLTVTISPEGWDEEKEEFVSSKVQTLQLEHSLISISKWESEWHKPFLSKQAKTPEETYSYIKYMTLNPNVDPDIYNHLTQANLEAINNYIDDPMTATTVREEKSGPGSREIVTSELIYFWMISYSIPFECQKWHLNKLLTLIRVCNVKNQTPKKMSKRELMNRNAALNASRRQQLNSKG